MPDLIPVENNPFNVNLVPVEGNPFALQGDVGSAIQQQNAAEAQRRATMSNLFHSTVGAPGTVAQPVMPQTPGMWSDEDEARRQATEAAAANWAPQQALNSIGSGMPMAERFGLGMAGGGIKAYHGSPYDFEKFDLSKIGTGEGAQAYGHGLYFAENPSVATNYRPHFNEPDKYVWNGRNLSDLQMKAQDKGDYGAAGVLERIQLHQPRHAIEQYFSEDPHDPQSIRALEYLKTVPESVFAKPSGNMYEVNINADPEHFLDWDKPLSEQHPKVQETLEQNFFHPTTDKMTGQQWIDEANSYARGNPGATHESASARTTERLREAGIPGIKYLDQFSRFGNIPSPVKDAAARVIDFYGGDPEVAMKQFENRISGLRSARANESLPLRHDRPADPQDVLSLLKSGWIPKQDETHNYVVFNDKLIDIIKKYGLAGLVAGGASHFTTTPVDHNPFAAQQ